MIIQKTETLINMNVWSIIVFFCYSLIYYMLWICLRRKKKWKKEHYEKKICNCSCTQSYFLFESQGTSLKQAFVCRTCTETICRNSVNYFYVDFTLNSGEFKFKWITCEVRLRWFCLSVGLFLVQTKTYMTSKSLQASFFYLYITFTCDLTLMLTSVHTSVLRINVKNTKTLNNKLSLKSICYTIVHTYFEKKN